MISHPRHSLGDNEKNFLASHHKFYLFYLEAEPYFKVLTAVSPLQMLSAYDI